MNLPKLTNNTTSIQETDKNPSSGETERAIKILGDKAKEMSNEQLNEVVSETKYLAQSLLDEFEKMVFKGKTLQDLLYERNRTS